MVVNDTFKIMDNNNREILLGLPMLKKLNILSQDWPKKYSVNIDYTCKKCDKYCDNFDELKEHRRKVHEIKGLLCSKCMTEFGTLEEEEEHKGNMHSSTVQEERKET